MSGVLLVITEVRIDSGASSRRVPVDLVLPGKVTMLQRLCVVVYRVLMRRGIRGDGTSDGKEKGL